VHHNGQLFTEEDAKADLVHEYYYNVLGKPFSRQHTIRPCRSQPRRSRGLSGSRPPIAPLALSAAFFKATWDNLVVFLTPTT
jgi:hypothetical protein